jgi:electron transfer flavoprotein beta subunit
MKKLDIVVCVKPVPDPKRWEKLKLDPETMLLARGEVPPVINPLDRNAVEAALALRAATGGKVTAVTMAPPDGEEQLREALAMGCDKGCLLTDRAFAGADTLATARVLAAAVRRLGAPDLVLCGAYSLDGSTSQVGPQVAQLLDIPDLTHAVSLEPAGDRLRVRCKFEGGTALFESDLPLLVTLDKEANAPRLAGLLGIRAARDKDVAVWGAKDLKLGAKEVGLAGSPTRMLNVYTPATRRKGEILQGPANEVASKLIARLRKEKVV